MDRKNPDVLGDVAEWLVHETVRCISRGGVDKQVRALMWFLPLRFRIVVHIDRLAFGHSEMEMLVLNHNTNDVSCLEMVVIVAA